MQVVRTLDVEVWANYVNQHPSGNVFHTPEMFKVFKNTTGYKPALWAVVAENNKPLALFLPVYVTLMGGPLYSFSTRAIVYGSILYTYTQEGEKALSMLLKSYCQEMDGKILFTELRNLIDMSACKDLLAQHNFSYEPHLNFLINLDLPVEEILQNIGKRTRKKIRKGLRDQTVVLRDVDNSQDLSLWYETLQKTYNYAQVPLAHASLFTATFDELHPKGMAKFLLATIEDEPVACSIELPYKDVIYGWYGGSDRAYSKYNPNEILLWHVFEWGANNNYKIYDFGGAGKPDEEYGVRDFKAKFGGDLVEFGRFSYVHSPTRLKLSEFAYKALRRFL